MMIRFLVFLSFSHFLAEGRLDPIFSEMAASKAQIRFAVENRYDDTGPGAKEPERAHKMYNNLDDALVAFMNDPDTKLPDAEKIRAFRKLVGTDYGLPPPKQQSPDLQGGPYKLISLDPIKYNNEPPSFSDSRPNNIWNSRRELKEQPQKEASSHVRFQQSQNSYRPSYESALLGRDMMNKDPFFEALKRDASFKHSVSHESLFDHSASRDMFQKPHMLKHNVFQHPSSNRVVFQQDVFSRNQPPSRSKPSFFDLQSTVVKADSQYLLPQSRREDEMARQNEYSYGYGVNDPKTGDWKSAQETRNKNGGVSGYYSLVEPDGKTRVVKYTADNGGFVATIDRPKGHFL